jgi:hypothetical protein
MPALIAFLAYDKRLVDAAERAGLPVATRSETGHSGAFDASGVSGLRRRGVQIGSVSRIGACASGGLTGQVPQALRGGHFPRLRFMNAPAWAL